MRKASECWCPMLRVVMNTGKGAQCISNRHEKAQVDNCLGSRCAWWRAFGNKAGACGACPEPAQPCDMMEDK